MIERKTPQQLSLKMFTKKVEFSMGLCDIETASIYFDLQDAAKRSRNNRDRNLANLRIENKLVSAEKLAKQQEYLDLCEIYENKIRLRDKTIQQYINKRQRLLDIKKRAGRKDTPG